MSDPTNPVSHGAAPHGVTIRAAQDADMPGIRAIATEFDLLQGWPYRSDFLDLERESGRLLVADGHTGVVGFAATLTRGTVTHLGDLFINPKAQSAGLGARLLAAILPPAGQPVVTYASGDPRALALYLRHGLLPRQPLWHLAGHPTTLPAAALQMHRTTVEEVVDLDAQVSGGRRHQHLSWYARQPGVAVWSTPGAYAFTRTDGNSCSVGPAGGRDRDTAVHAVLGAVRLAAADQLAVRLAVFGTHPAAAVLLRAGLRIVDHDTLMTSHDHLFDADRYVPDADLG